jgi:hypothetical protein
MEVYFVFKGSFSTMKKSKLPSAEIVGLSSGNVVLMLAPKFSTFTMVEALIMFSFCAINFPVESSDGCARDKRLQNKKRRIKVSFKGQDLWSKIIEK